MKASNKWQVTSGKSLQVPLEKGEAMYVFGKKEAGGLLNRTPLIPLFKGDKILHKSKTLNQKSPAFSLIEVIVSIVILGIVVGGAMKLIDNSLSLHRANSQRVSAVYLAQECLELTRNQRDTNWMQSQPWNQDLAKDVTTQVGNFTRSITMTDPTPEEVSSMEVGDEIGFQQVAEPQSLKITCRVSWEDGEVALAHILSNWRK